MSLRARRVSALRVFFADRRHFAMIVAAMTLVIKAMIPPGYMIGEQSRALSVIVCADASNTGYVKQITIPVSSKTGGSSDERGKSEGACPYSVMSMVSLGGADAPLLVVALAFIVALGFAPFHFPPPVRTRHDRPPLRGPPFLA
jgi:hypothetical protein